MKKIVLLCCFLVTATFSPGQVLHVPAEYLTIQDGINAANPGDTVLVADGIYYERINFMGKKPLLVASEFIIDGNPMHIANTIVDGSLFPFLNKSVVYFILGEDTTSVLCGFTIQNGSGTFYQADNQSWKAGGGIFISGSGARIIHNHITQNHLNYNMLVDDVDIFDGSAIATEWQDDDSWVIIENNVIDLNTCISNNSVAGGSGICIYYNSRIAYNTISNNICTCYGNGSAFAGGLACTTDREWESMKTAIVKNNIISNNVVSAENKIANGAGVYLQHVFAEFTDNILQNNHLITGPAGGGSGGLGIYMPLDGTVISGNMFMDNSSTLWSGAMTLETTAWEATQSRILIENNYFANNHSKEGGAVTVFGVPVNFQNNVFSGNSADARGGAILTWKLFDLPFYHMVKLINNSFYGNSAATGGALYSVRSRPLVFNTVFYNDEAGTGPECYIPYPTDTLEIAFSNIDMSKVYGRINDGGNNITEDPLFKDPMLLTLELGSPCIDAGTGSIACDCGVLHYSPAYDIDGIPREDSPIDIGAHEILGITGLPQLKGNIPFAELNVHPNPASHIAHFEYDLYFPGHIQLTVCTVAGKEIALLADEFQYKGIHNIEWNIDGLMKGIYIYRLVNTDNYQQLTGKLVVIQ